MLKGDINMKRNTIIAIIVIFIIIIILFFIIFTLNNNSDSNSHYLKEYITSKYNIELNDICKTGLTRNNNLPYGLFTPVNDPSYLIQITKDGNEYNCSYNPEHIKVRKELMDEIIKYKGENAVTSFLEFYKNGNENGPVISNSSANEFLSFVVYVDKQIDIEKNMKEDYMIMRKANDLLKKYSNKSLNKITVYYTTDSKVLNKDWIYNANDSLDFLTLAPTYLFESAKTNSGISNYKYSVGLNRKYNIELNAMTESQFIQYGKLTLLSK